MEDTRAISLKLESNDHLKMLTLNHFKFESLSRFGRGALCPSLWCWELSGSAAWLSLQLQPFRTTHIPQGYGKAPTGCYAMRWAKAYKLVGVILGTCSPLNLWSSGPSPPKPSKVTLPVLRKVFTLLHRENVSS